MRTTLGCNIGTPKISFLFPINKMDPENTGLIYFCPGWLPDLVIIHKHVRKMTGSLKAVKLNLFHTVPFNFKRGSMCPSALERKSKKDWKDYIKLQSAPCNATVQGFCENLRVPAVDSLFPNGKRGSGDCVPSQHVISNIEPEFWLLWQLLIQLWS